MIKRVGFFVFLRCRIFIRRSHGSRLSAIVKTGSFGFIEIDLSFWCTNHFPWHRNQFKEKVELLKSRHKRKENNNLFSLVQTNTTEISLPVGLFAPWETTWHRFYPISPWAREKMLGILNKVYCCHLSLNFLNWREMVTFVYNVCLYCECVFHDNLISSIHV